MAITLAQAKVGMADKVDQNIIDLVQRESAFMNSMTYDDAVSPGTGGSTLTYGYLQTTTPASAAGRSINSEYTAQHAVKTQKTVDLQIMGGSFEIDRVLAANSSKRNDEVAYQIEEKTKATVSRFQYLAVNGNKSTTNEFDGLNTLLAGTENEINSASVDVHGAMTAAHAEDLCEALDLAIASLDGAPSMILVNTKMKVKLIAAARMLNYFDGTGKDEFGQPVEKYGATPIVDMKQYYNGTNTVDVIPVRSAAEYRVQVVTSSTFKTDGSFAASADGYLYTESSGTYTKVSSGSFSSSATYYILLGAANTTDIYVVRLGLNGMHAVTPQGGVGINTILPDFNQAGAVHKGEVEMVGAVALKTTKAAAVLRAIKVA